ncbi:MAG: hypothetical protein ACLTYN_06350 [Dysosmobacter welbionis]
MADPKKNPLIGAFRAPVPGAPPDTPRLQRRENRLPLEPPSLSTRRKDRRPPRPLRALLPSPLMGRRNRRPPRPLRTPPPSLPMGKGAGGPCPCGHYSQAH